jgi:hypothetical protein
VAVQSGAEAVEEGDGAEPRAEGLAGGGVRHDGHRGAEPPLDLVEENPRQGGDGRGPVGEERLASGAPVSVSSCPPITSPIAFITDPAPIWRIPTHLGESRGAIHLLLRLDARCRTQPPGRWASSRPIKGRVPRPAIACGRAVDRSIFSSSDLHPVEPARLVPSVTRIPWSCVRITPGLVVFDDCGCGPCALPRVAARAGVAHRRRLAHPRA